MKKVLAVNFPVMYDKFARLFRFVRSLITEKLTVSSILELRGLGKHLWQDVSVKNYINAERDSWNGYSQYSLRTPDAIQSE